VTAIVASSSDVYVGLEGAALAGGVVRRCALALRAPDGSLDPRFNPSFEPVGELPCVQSLALAGSLYVGGYFTSVAGRRAQGLTALDATTGRLEKEFTPAEVRCQACVVRHPGVTAIAASRRYVYVAGLFTSIGADARDHLAALAAGSGAVVPGWRPTIHGGEALKLELVGSRLYLGGEFDAVDGKPRNGFAALDAETGELLPTWKPPKTTRYILALALSGQALFAGGAER
jgi:hypothetical protein